MVRPAHLIHLARRFFGSLPPGGPPAVQEAWALSALGVGEQALWERMSGPDRRHAVAVARAVGGTDRAVTAAALLHDVGKIDAALGTFARAGVTAVSLIAGRDRIIDRFPGSRAARYLRHDTIGADLLREAGADPLTVAWAREHHLAPRDWTVPHDVGLALKAADDD